MKITIHCDERITNIRHTIYVKLFWGIIIANELTYLLDYFFKTSLNGWVIPLAPDVLIIWMSIKGVLFNGTQHFPLWCWLFALCYSSLNTIIALACCHCVSIPEDIRLVPGWADRAPAICCNTGYRQNRQR